MKSITSVCILLCMMTKETEQLKIRYKSDDVDDLLEGVITNQHTRHENDKPKGEVDTLVQEAYDTAMAENGGDKPRLMV